MDVRPQSNDIGALVGRLNLARDRSATDFTIKVQERICLSAQIKETLDPAATLFSHSFAL
jgi:hypothetical protein